MTRQIWALIHAIRPIPTISLPWIWTPLELPLDIGILQKCRLTVEKSSSLWCYGRGACSFWHSLSGSAIFGRNVVKWFFSAKFAVSGGHNCGAVFLRLLEKYGVVWDSIFFVESLRPCIDILKSPVPNIHLSLLTQIRMVIHFLPVIGL